MAVLAAFLGYVSVVSQLLIDNNAFSITALK
jgi:hypothetical protein